MRDGEAGVGICEGKERWGADLDKVRLFIYFFVVFFVGDRD